MHEFKQQLIDDFKSGNKSGRIASNVMLVLDKMSEKGLLEKFVENLFCYNLYYNARKFDPEENPVYDETEDFDFYEEFLDCIEETFSLVDDNCNHLGLYHTAIDDAFTWVYTPEGEDFWLQIYNQVKE